MVIRENMHTLMNHACMEHPRARLMLFAFVIVTFGGIVAKAGCFITSCVAMSKGMSNKAARLSWKLAMGHFNVL
jgi:hypothetical protein